MLEACVRYRPESMLLVSVTSKTVLFPSILLFSVHNRIDFDPSIDRERDNISKEEEEVARSSLVNRKLFEIKYWKSVCKGR